MSHWWKRKISCRKIKSDKTSKYMNLKQFRSLGGKTKWQKMTPEQQKAHIAKMTAKAKKVAMLKRRMRLSTDTLARNK